jgi:hypothetical protein
MQVQNLFREIIINDVKVTFGHIEYSSKSAGQLKRRFVGAIS